MAIILVEQYFDFAYTLADHFYVLRRGAVAKSGARAYFSREDPARRSFGLVGNQSPPPTFCHQA